MSIQIFKSKISTEVLFSFLENVDCLKNKKYYLFNNDAFKRGVFNNKIAEFIENIKPHYHLSKQKYVDGEINYKKMTTILRQICNYNNITYTSKIKYDKSLYEIQYYIYF